MFSRLRLVSRTLPKVNATLSPNSIPAAATIAKSKSALELSSSVCRPELSPLSLGSVRPFSTTSAGNSAATLDSREHSSLEASLLESSNVNSAEDVWVSQAQQIRSEFEALKAADSSAKTLEAYTELLNKITRDFKLALEVMLDMKEAGVAVNDEVFLLVLRAGRRSLHVRDQTSLFCERSGWIGGSEHYDAVSKVYDAAKDANVAFPISFYEEMTADLSRKNNYYFIQQVISYLKDKGIAPTPFIFNRHLECLANAGLAAEETALFEKLKAEGVADIGTHICHLNSLAKRNSIEELKAAFEEIAALEDGKFKNIHPYNILISGYLKNDQVAKAEEVVEKIKADGLEVTSVTNYLFLRHFYLKKDFHAARTVLSNLGPFKLDWQQQMQSMYIRAAARFSPTEFPAAFDLYISCEKKDCNHYNCMLTVLLDRSVEKSVSEHILAAIPTPAEDAPDARFLGKYANQAPIFIKHLLKDMEKNHVTVNETTISLFAQALSNAQAHADILRLYSDLKFIPKKIYNYALTAAMKTGDVSLAQSIAETMKVRRVLISDNNMAALKRYGFNDGHDTGDNEQGSGRGFENNRRQQRSFDNNNRY